jgi:hypothetical protein
MRAKALIAMVPIAGALILFLSWVIQQTLLEQARDDLGQLSAANTTFQTYQSNNALFNAIIESTSKNRSDSDPQPGGQASVEDHIRAVQIYNYELGLQSMEGLLDDADRRDIPAPVDAYGSTMPFAKKLEIVQDRLEKIQGGILKKTARIKERQASYTLMFSGAYALGSLLVLAGSVLTALEAQSGRQSSVATKLS